MTKDEALRMALEALEKIARYDSPDEMAVVSVAREAITAIKEALAQPEQEPLAWMNDMGTHIDLNVSGRGTPLYTTPPQRKPLTDEMVVAAARVLSDRLAAACNVDCGDMWKLDVDYFIEGARAALEAAHGIKE